MKIITQPVVIIGLLAGLAIPALAEDNEQTVKWSDLPAAVQNTITANASGGKVGKIEVETENGATTYEAKVKSNDAKMEIEVAADGTLLETETKLDLDDVPAAVQSTITANASGGKVKKIEKETEKGVTTYEAKVKAGDKETEIKVAADGTLINAKSEDEDDDKGGDHKDKDDDDKDGK